MDKTRNALSLVGCLWLLSVVSFAQHGTLYRIKHKVSNAPGTLFMTWGYNRSYFSNSKIHFFGPNYGFSLSNIPAVDDPKPYDRDIYFRRATINTTQYNGRIGYYFKKKYALSVGIDHTNYITRETNKSQLSGTFYEGADTVNNWIGTYYNNFVTIDHNKINYNNQGGLNYLRLELTRTGLLYRSHEKNIALSSNLGLGIGALVTKNTFLFNGRQDVPQRSLAGIGFSITTGLRIEIFKNLTFQSEIQWGHMSLQHVKTRDFDETDYAKQKFLYASVITSGGLLFFIRPTNECDTCPLW
jgi:hypothetical protein